MVECSVIPEGMILWSAAYVWAFAFAGDSLAKRRRVALERLAAVVAEDTGIGPDHAMRRAAEILGPLAHA